MVCLASMRHASPSKGCQSEAGARPRVGPIANRAGVDAQELTLCKCDSNHSTSTSGSGSGSSVTSVDSSSSRGSSTAAVARASDKTQRSARSSVEDVLAIKSWPSAVVQTVVPGDNLHSASSSPCRNTCSPASPLSLQELGSELQAVPPSSPRAPDEYYIDSFSDYDEAELARSPSEHSLQALNWSQCIPAVTELPIDDLSDYEDDVHAKASSIRSLYNKAWEQESEDTY
mmetsp:Transcript_113718/g.321588  ORF Transcript_113718/g.321588 Transcript_113718/m.321588 type:complete len:230 (+) Transcript_113718:108-797(+)